LFADHGAPVAFHGGIVHGAAMLRRDHTLQFVFRPAATVAQAWVARLSGQEFPAQDRDGLAVDHDAIAFDSDADKPATR
jgi:hypothetical protein